MAAATHAVTGYGSQPSYPDRDGLERILEAMTDRPPVKRRTAVAARRHRNGMRLASRSGRAKEIVMAIAKVVELSAASPKSFEDAIRDGIARASQTLRNIQGVWVHEQHVKVENNAITEWRVIMKVTFVMDDR